MKKILAILSLLLAVGITVAFIAPNKLPRDIQTHVYKVKRSLGLNSNVVSHEKSLYKNTKKDGSIEFSDIQENHGVKHSHSNSGNFIAMESAVDKEKTPYGLPEGSSGVAAVLDPVNSINSETAKSVEKMRAEKAKKMAEQGL